MGKYVLKVSNIDIKQRLLSHKVTQPIGFLIFLYEGTVSSNVKNDTAGFLGVIYILGFLAIIDLK